MSLIDKYKKYITDPKNRTNVIIGGIIAFFAFFIVPELIFIAVLFLLIYFIFTNFKQLIKKNKLILSINLAVLIILLTILAAGKSSINSFDFFMFAISYVLQLVINLVGCLFFLKKDKLYAKHFLLSFALVLLIGFSSCTAIMFSIN